MCEKRRLVSSFQLQFVLTLLFAVLFSVRVLVSEEKQRAPIISYPFLWVNCGINFGLVFCYFLHLLAFAMSFLAALLIFINLRLFDHDIVVL